MSNTLNFTYHWHPTERLIQYMLSWLLVTYFRPFSRTHSHILQEVRGRMLHTKIYFAVSSKLFLILISVCYTLVPTYFKRKKLLKVQKFKQERSTYLPKHSLTTSEDTRRVLTSTQCADDGLIYLHCSLNLQWFLYRF